MDRDEVQTSTHVVVDLKVVQVILTVCVGLAPDGLVVAQKPERAASAAGSPQKLKRGIWDQMCGPYTHLCLSGLHGMVVHICMVWLAPFPTTKIK